jgi:hypothetical protein
MSSLSQAPPWATSQIDFTSTGQRPSNPSDQTNVSDFLNRLMKYRGSEEDTGDASSLRGKRQVAPTYAQRRLFGEAPTASYAAKQRCRYHLSSRNGSASNEQLPSRVFGPAKS